MTIVIVSPHFDDAVFSCWNVIESEAEVDVLTVFTAGPVDDRVTLWDQDTGVDSATRMKQRATENDAALAHAGRRSIDLGFREGQYDGGSIDPTVLRSHLASAELVYIPAGCGIKHVNSEHCSVRDACLSVRPDARFYADNPYCHFRRDVVLPAGLGIGFTRTVISLSPGQRARKAEAIKCYAGELAKLEAVFGPCTEADRLKFEIVWEPSLS